MIKPLADRVVVEVLPEEETTVGGIILAATTTDNLSRGKVVAVGPGGFSFTGEPVAIQVEVGVTVFFEPYRGYGIRDSDGASYRVIDEKDLIAAIE